MRRLNRIIPRIGGGVILAIGLFAAPALAFDDGDGPFHGAGLVSLETLERERAKGFPDELFGDVTVANNTITAGAPGMNSISDSFLGSSGGVNCICTVMQNTGNSAVMQHATIIQTIGPAQ